LLDALAEYPFDPHFRAAHGLDERPILALLPGSRKQEIAKKLPVMLKAAAQFPQCQVVVAAAPGQPVSFYQEIAQGQPMRAISGVTYQLLHTAEAAMVTSGTATLETALIGCPELVAYKSSLLSYEIGKRLVKVPFISLVNLILNRKLVQEFIQNDCTPAKLAAETRLLLENAAYRSQIKAGYAELREKLGGAGASKRAAEKIFTLLSDK
jgi:lipid-A-disaccharide synthase